LAAALFIASLGRFKFRGKLLTAGSFGFPLLLIVFAFVRSTPLALVILLGVGFSLILVFNLSNSAVQTLTPEPLRGRVMSIYSLTFFGSLPIGSLIIGWLASHKGEPTAVVVNTTVTLAFATALFIFVPRLRRLE
jgi:hypothetical protein